LEATRKATALLGISGTELAIVLIFGFLIFGPDRLPAMGRTIGRALRQFRQAQDQMNKMVQTEIVNPLNEAAKEPAKKQGPKKKVSVSGAASKPETFAEKKARLAAEASAKAQGTVVAEGGQAEAAPVKKAGTSETFAQKKARLDAEKAAAAAAKQDDDAKPAAAKTTTAKGAGKKPASSAAKLYGIDKDRIAAARAAAAQKTTEKEEQADA
jgi:sec-independent protein translocase protein TatB/colicin import membrane protein